MGLVAISESKVIYTIRPLSATLCQHTRGVLPPLAFVPITVAEAHQSYNVMCRADGMMYHDALGTAARTLKIPVELLDRGQEMARASERLDVTPEKLEQFLHAAGEGVGRPWQKEHRLAAAAAMGVLADRQRLSLSV